MPQNDPFAALAAYLQGTLPEVLSTLPPPSAPAAPVQPPSLADMARASGRPQMDVTKVTISGQGGKGLKHGQRYVYSPEQGGTTLVWDSVKGKYVERRNLSAAPDRVTIEKK